MLTYETARPVKFVYLGWQYSDIPGICNSYAAAKAALDRTLLADSDDENVWRDSWMMWKRSHGENVWRDSWMMWKRSDGENVWRDSWMMWKRSDGENV